MNAVSRTCVLLTVALVSLAGGSAAHAETFFSLFGSGGGDDQYSLTLSGITLTVTAESGTNGQFQSVNVHQSSRGMGVHVAKGDQGQIDGLGSLDILWLEFSRPVTLTRANVSLIGPGDDVRFLDGAGNKAADAVNPKVVFDGLAWIDLKAMSYDFTGTRFGLTAIGADDDYRLRKIAVVPASIPNLAQTQPLIEQPLIEETPVTPVSAPLPAAVWPGLLLLGAAALRRRRDVA